MRRGMLMFGVVMSMSAWAYAQGLPTVSTARRFAPAIWLSPDEITYPMLPHAFAFDGVDNDEDGCLDLADPDEVGALVGDHNNKARRDEVAAMLMRLATVRRSQELGEDVSQHVATSPQACSPKTNQLKKFKFCKKSGDEILCGPPAVILAEVAELGDPKNLGGSASEPVESVGSVQYWMYYPWDGGHLHDGEHVTTFFSPEHLVRGVVGAGHLASTPNNVLVARHGNAGAHLNFPMRIPEHLPVLSELGKHASAPDLNCNGRFDPGLDVNDLPSGAWGTRDANHGIGTSNWTPFENWTSFDRVSGTLLLERTAWTAPGDLPETEKAIPASWRESCPSFSLGRRVIDRNLAEASRSLRHLWSYRIVLASDVREVVEGLAKGTLLPSDPTYLNLIESLPASTPGIALKNWGSPESECSTDPRPDVWNHCDFAKPRQDFKLHLIPRLDVRTVFTLEGGNAKGGLGVRLTGVGPFRDSSLEFQVLIDNLNGEQAVHNRDVLSNLGTGIAPGRGRKFEGVVLYNAFGTAHRGLYVGASYRRLDYLYRGVAIVPVGEGATSASSAVLVERTGNNFNLEAGFAFRPPISKPITLRFGISGPIVRGRSSEIREGEISYFRHPTSMEARVSVEFRLWAAWKRPDPLRIR